MPVYDRYDPILTGAEVALLDEKPDPPYVTLSHLTPFAYMEKPLSELDPSQVAATWTQVSVGITPLFLPIVAVPPPALSQTAIVNLFVGSTWKLHSRAAEKPEYLEMIQFPLSRALKLIQQLIDIGELINDSES